jgi:hypothetical protein
MAMALRSSSVRAGSHGQAIEHCCCHQRSGAAAVRAVRVGVVLEQQLKRSVLVVTHSCEQRGHLDLLPRPLIHNLAPLVQHRRPATVQQLAQLAAVSLLYGGAQRESGHQRL